MTGVGTLLMPVDDALLLASGIAFGYVAYGLSHFMIHHMRFRNGLMRKWAASHHIHHRHPDCNFGVTTPLWDVVLGTRYVSSASPSRSRSRTAS
jgi:sterol desaturase/sphingolipid hydroxylase (fatty acid hydroxylase superfamily)